MTRTMQKGFTLIELMIVVAIIGILAAVALPQYRNYTEKSAVNACLAEAKGAMNGLTAAILSGEKDLIPEIQFQSCVKPNDFPAAANGVAAELPANTVTEIKFAPISPYGEKKEIACRISNAFCEIKDKTTGGA